MKHLIVVACFLSLLAGACSGGGSRTNTPAIGSPEARASVLSNAQTVIAPPDKTPTAFESTAIATEFDLEEFHHDAAPRLEGEVIDFSYTILLPKGWTTAVTGITLNSSLLKPDNFPVATITVDCRPGVDKSEMIAKDGEVATKLSFGNLATVPRQPVKVGGRDAIRADWRGGSAGFPSDRISIYVNGDSCAWRLQINAFGGVSANDVAALFARIADKFNPAQGLPKS